MVAEDITYNPLSGQFDFIGGSNGAGSGNSDGSEDTFSELDGVAYGRGLSGYSKVLNGAETRPGYYFKLAEFIPHSDEDSELRAAIKVIALCLNPYTSFADRKPVYAELELKCNSPKLGSRRAVLRAKHLSDGLDGECFVLAYDAGVFSLYMTGKAIGDGSRAFYTASAYGYKGSFRLVNNAGFVLSGSFSGLGSVAVKAVADFDVEGKADKATTLAGYGITDALAREGNLSDVEDRQTALNNLTGSSGSERGKVLYVNPYGDAVFAHITWTGTQDDWDNLTDMEKQSYLLAVITED